MSVHVNLRSMILNDVMNKVNTSQIIQRNNSIRASQLKRAPGIVGNEMPRNEPVIASREMSTHMVHTEHSRVLRSLHEYKLYTHMLGVALIITLLATSALWVWAIALYEQLTFIG